MIQQRVQVCLLLVLFAVSTIAMGSNFPDILVQKDGSEVRGTLLEKKADGSGTFQKFNGEFLSSAPRRSPTSDQQPVRMPNLIRQSNQEQKSLKQSTNPTVSTNIPGVIMYEPETDKLAVQLPLGRGVALRWLQGNKRTIEKFVSYRAPVNWKPG